MVVNIRYGFLKLTSRARGTRALCAGASPPSDLTLGVNARGHDAAALEVESDGALLERQSPLERVDARGAHFASIPTLKRKQPGVG